MNTRCRYTKKQLSKDLGITQKRLTIELKILEPELLEKFPSYSRNSQILRLQIYGYILEQIGGYEPEDIKKITARNFVENFK